MLLVAVLASSALVGLALPQTVKLNDPLARPIGGAVLRFAHGASGDRLVYVADQDIADVPQIYSVPFDASAPAIKLSPGSQAVGSGIAVSPDGQRVAFLAQKVVYVAPTDGSSAALALTGAITMDDPDSFEPRFSADGAWIVYRELVDQIGWVSLYSVPTDGSLAPIALSSSPGEFAISPDGARVVFNRQDGLYSAPIDGTQAAVSLSNGSDGVNEFALTPDGTTVVYLDSPLGMGVELFRVPIDGSSSAIKLSGTMIYGGAVISFAIAGGRVVFRADLQVDQRFELYSVPLDGSASPTKLSGAPISSSDVQRFLVTPDGRRVVFVADRDTNDVFELYLTAVDGSSKLVRLNAPMVSGGDVDPSSPFQITPDSSTVVYRADQTEDGTSELYSVTLGKVQRDALPRSLRISAPLAAGKDVTSFVLSPSGRFAVYVADGLADGRVGSFAVPVRGGDSVGLTLPASAPGGSVGATVPALQDRGLFLADFDGLSGVSLYAQSLAEAGPATQLNEPLPLGSTLGDVHSYACTPGGDVLYIADQERDGVFELYRVPADGGADPVKLSSPMVFGGSIGGAFAPSPDGTRFTYVADQEVDARPDLYAGPVDGSSPPVRLDGPSTAFFDGVQPGMRFTLDGERVIYRIRRASTDQSIELYSARADGSAAPVRLNGTFASGSSHVEGDFALSSDGQRVVYRSDEAALARLELYSVPCDGSLTRVRLHTALGTGRNVTDFRISPDSSTVVFLVDRPADNRFELYSVAITGGTTTPLDPLLNSFSDVTSFEISPDGTRVVYRADRGVDEQFELYSVPITGGTSVKLNGPVVAGGDIGLSDEPGLGWKIAADGARVVFLGDPTVGGELELFSAPIDGGTAALPLDGPVLPVYSRIDVTADSRRVVFLGRTGVSGPVRAWSAPLDASAAPRELGSIPVDESAWQFELHPSGIQALVTTRDNPPFYNTFSVHRVVIGSGRTDFLAGGLSSSTQWHFASTPTRALFLADLDEGGVLELYSARLPRFPWVSSSPP